MERNPSVHSKSSEMSKMKKMQSRRNLKKKLGLNPEKSKISLVGPSSPLYELMN